MLEEPMLADFPNPEDNASDRVNEFIPTVQKKCVCEMCTCGIHHCPRPKIRGIFETTYKHDFQKYALRRPAPELPKQEYKIRHYDKSTLVTSYDDYNKTSDLIKKRRQERAACQSQTKCQPSIFQNSAKVMLRQGPKFIGVSEYKDHYKQFPQREKSLPAHFLMQNIPLRFDGESSYKLDYKSHVNKPKNLQTINVQISSPSIKQQYLSSKTNMHLPEEFQQNNYPPRMKTMPDIYSACGCPCEAMKLPVFNNTDHLHLKYDPIKREWQ